MPQTIQLQNPVGRFTSPGPLLLLAWTIVQTALLIHFGIRTDLEPVKYISEANHLLETGTVSSPNFWLYSTQIFLFTLAIKFNTGFVPVYLVQLLLNGVATWQFYRFSRHWFGGRSAFLITLVLIFTIPLQLFNCILQTESIFFSLTLIFSCYLLQLEKPVIKDWIVLSVLMFVILFTRPTGLLFLPGFLLYILWTIYKKKGIITSVIFLIAGLILFFLILNRAMGSGGELNFIYPFQTETIICGVPGMEGVANINMPENPNSIEGLIYYMMHNTGQFLRLAVEKTKSFFFLTRPYYSGLHNISLVMLITPFYILCMLSLRWWWKNRRMPLFYSGTFIFITWMSVIASCDDWHNRFFLTVIPYIYILSMPALKTILDKFFQKNNAV